VLWVIGCGGVLCDRHGAAASEIQRLLQADLF
jgi:hypothetical protein